MTDVLLKDLKDGVLTLTLNRPDKRNALSPELQSLLISAFTDAARDDAVRTVVLTGSGDKMFCSGGDLGEMSGDEGFLKVHEGRGKFAELLSILEGFPKPTVCRVGGHAMAGGIGLVLACDLVAAADDVTFSTPEVARGLFPMMISALIVRQLGRKRAYELMLLGDRWTASQAREAGMVNFVVARAELDAKVAQVATRLASYSPAIMTLGKRALHDSSEMGMDEALRYLHTQLTLNLMTEDAMEGISAFLQKREPNWKGR
ncbi:MAG: enoyl-CoA hydratase-related protein [Myxococcota bacterium]